MEIMNLDNYSINSAESQLEPKKSRKENTNLETDNKKQNYLVTDSEAISICESRYQFVNNVWVDLTQHRVVNNNLDFDYTGIEGYRFYKTGWINLNTNRFYSNSRDMVSILKNKSKTRKTQKLENENIQKIVENCTYSYLIEGQDLRYPMKHLQDFFSVEVRRQNIEHLTRVLRREFFFKFEVSVNNHPHLHFLPSINPSSKILEKLKVKPDPQELEERLGGVTGYLGYLLKPVWFDKQDNPNPNITKNLQVFLGNYLKSGFESGQRITCNYGVRVGTGKK